MITLWLSEPSTRRKSSPADRSTEHHSLAGGEGSGAEGITETESIACILSRPERAKVSRTAAGSTASRVKSARRGGRGSDGFHRFPGTTTMNQQDNPLTIFAATNFRGSDRPFGIRERDRFQHVYCCGKSGTGKSSVLQAFIRSDLERGQGLALIDPHGDLAERVLHIVPRHRLADVVYFNAGDLEYPVPFNVLESVTPDQRHLVASTLVSILKRFWADFWGPRTEYLIRNSVLALLEAPSATLLDMSRLLVDDDFRSKILAQVKNPGVANFWANEYAAYTSSFRQEVIAPVQNKVGEFLLTPLVRNIVGQRKNLFQFRHLMDEGKVLICNLTKGQIGEDTSALLGSMLITRLFLAAMSRADVIEEERRPFFLYVDEFPSFGTQSTFSALLSEARKFKLSVMLAHQYMAQLSDDLRSAIFGNVGTIISFRVGAEDASYLAREFAPVFSEADFVNLANHEIYLKLSVNSLASAPFSARTFPPHIPDASCRDQVVRLSRERYARRREIVERGAGEHYLASRGVSASAQPPGTYRSPWPKLGTR